MEPNLKPRNTETPFLGSTAERNRAEEAKRELLEYYKERRRLYPIGGRAEVIEHG
ncbi:MAG: hypothetical protein QNJ35_17990 [Paracoccaceae bacterium]|nr:hypothetical protein [Paracoccaceae bacterium]